MDGPLSDAEIVARVRSGWRLIPPKRGAPPVKTIKAVLTKRRAGWKYEAIAADLDLTKGQVAGILWRYTLDAEGHLIGSALTNPKQEG